MRIIDANTGTEPRIGLPFQNIMGTVTVLRVKEGVFSAKALLDVNGHQYWTPLTVRYMHPGFMFQKIGFINS